MSLDVFFGSLFICGVNVMLRFLSIFLLLMLVWTCSVWAENVAGHVVMVQKQATLEREGNKRNLDMRESIYSGDKIVTGGQDVAEISLEDDSFLIIGPDSELSLDDYAFTAYENRLLINCGRGLIKISSGDIAKKNPEAFNFNSPEATIEFQGPATILLKCGPGLTELYVLKAAAPVIFNQLEVFEQQGISAKRLADGSVQTSSVSPIADKDLAALPTEMFEQ